MSRESYTRREARHYEDRNYHGDAKSLIKGLDKYQLYELYEIETRSEYLLFVEHVDYIKRRTWISLRKVDLSFSPLYISSQAPSESWFMWTDISLSKIPSSCLMF